MVWMRRVGVVVLSVAVIGCTDFVGTEGGGEDGGSSSSTSNSGGTTGTPVGTSVATQGGSGDTTAGPGTASTNPSTGTSAGTTDDSTTDATTNADSGSTDDTQGLTTGPSGSSTTGDPTQGGEDSTSTTSDECMQIDPEPNDVENPDEFVNLGTFTCGESAVEFQGTIENEFDEDWLAFFGDWAFCGQPNPAVDIDIEDDNVQVCVSPACQANVTAVYQCAAGTNWSAGGDDLGCCSTDRVRMLVNCDGSSNESLYANIRVRSADAVCEDYTLTYIYESQ